MHKNRLSPLFLTLLKLVGRSRNAVAVSCSCAILVVAAPALAVCTVSITGPSIYTNDDTPLVTATTSGCTGHGAQVTFKCQINQIGYFDCPLPYTLPYLTDATYALNVKVYQNGVYRDTDLLWFVIDTINPVTDITDGPCGTGAGPCTTTDSTPSFQFTTDDTEGNDYFQCRLDGESWSVCSSPKSYGVLKHGSHTFEVKATDSAGNTDASPEPQTFFVNSVPSFEDGLNPFSAATQLYVDDRACCATSNCTTKDGTTTNPYCTLEEAEASRSGGVFAAGTAVWIKPGNYEGGQTLSNIAGTSTAPVWIGGFDPNDKPVFEGIAEAIKLTPGASGVLNYVVLHNVIARNTSSHGINIDDGGQKDVLTATDYIVVRDVEIDNVGVLGHAPPQNIYNCLKLTGLNHFVVRNSSFTNCGMSDLSEDEEQETSGDGIDLVGCHHGTVASNYFNSRKALQTKGGSEDIEIRWNHIIYNDVGSRDRVAVKLGGVHGSGPPEEEFRPSTATAEGRNIRLIANVIEGGHGAVSFDGCVDCLAANNTIIKPVEYVVRLEQANTNLGVDKCDGGRFLNNIVYWNPANTGNDWSIDSDLESSAFESRNNIWYDETSNIGYEPDVPTLYQVVVDESGNVYPSSNGFNFVQEVYPYLISGSPADGGGSTAVDSELTEDRFGTTFTSPPSIGAHEP